MQIYQGNSPQHLFLTFPVLSTLHAYPHSLHCINADLLELCTFVPQPARGFQGPPPWCMLRSLPGILSPTLPLIVLFILPGQTKMSLLLRASCGHPGMNCTLLCAPTWYQSVCVHTCLPHQPLSSLGHGLQLCHAWQKAYMLVTAW